MPGELRKVVPGPLKALIAGLAALAVMLLAGSLFAAARARRLARQRQALVRDVGALQAALLPTVPRRIGGLSVSAAYRPAEGPCAGGDFYDVFPLRGERVGVLVGDMSGHGREALAPTAFLRYTVRAHMEAGVELRAALRLANAAFERTSHDAGFATVLAAVYDPRAGTLSYAGAGHAPPIVVGPAGHDPIVVGSSPPLGLGLQTGLRQTTISLPPDSLACMYTDGLADGRAAGRILGDERLTELVASLAAGATADALVERVAAEADHLPDDLAVCLLRPDAGGARSRVHVEELEVAADERATAGRFLSACGVPLDRSARKLSHLSGALGRGQRALLRVTLGHGVPAVEVIAAADEERGAAGSGP